MGEEKANGLDVIYLHDQVNDPWAGSLTWCQDKISSDDIQYVRSSWLLSVLEQAPGCEKAAEIVRASIADVSTVTG